MKYWNDIDNSTFFNRVFSYPVPIDQLELAEINIGNERNNIVIGFDILEIPDNPPAKWQKTEYNTCRIGIDCGEIHSLLIKNTPAAETLNIKISKADTHYHIQASNNESIIDFAAKFICLRGPSVYFSTERLQKKRWRTIK